MDNDQKQNALDQMLSDLSKNQEVLKNDTAKYVDLLEGIYCNEFRHKYSNFYAVLTKVDTIYPGALDILNQNISILHENISNKYNEDDEVYKGVNKLYDHINLDISRINYIRSISERAEQLEKDLQEVASQSGESYKKVEKLQRESVTILGIFVSIAVAFFSAIGFSSSILTNIERASIYRLSFIIILLAIVLFNLLVVLTNFVRDMTSVNHSIQDETVKCFNKILIGLLIIVIITWAIDLVGLRYYWIWKCG